MSIGNLLKKNIPEFQQGSPQLDSYLDAAGEFLDGTKEAIENIDNIHDYKNSTPYFFENTLKDRGYAIPSRIREDTKRRVLRDLAEIHKKNGTLEGIIHAVRMAGLTPEIRVGWIPSPRAIRQGRIIDPVTREERPYDINRYVYTDLLYGDVISTEDGVFFEGYRYEDNFNEDKIGPLAIFGERYAKTPDNPVPVAKSPYIIVKFQEGNKTIVVDPVVDPETGEIFEYSISEEFQLINDSLKYFLVENNRPTTMRIIIIVSLQPVEEELVISDSYTDAHEYNPDGGDDLTSERVIVDTVSGNGVVDGSAIVIGSTNIIGTPSPYASRHSAININIADDYTAIPEVYEWAECISRTFHNVGETPFLIPMRGETYLWFVAPATDTVIVKGHKYLGDTSPDTIATVLPTQTYFLEVPVQYHLIELSYDIDGLDRPLGISVWYKEQKQILDAPFVQELLTEDGFILTTEDSESILIEL